MGMSIKWANFPSFLPRFRVLVEGVVVALPGWVCLGILGISALDFPLTTGLHLRMTLSQVVETYRF